MRLTQRNHLTGLPEKSQAEDVSSLDNVLQDLEVPIKSIKQGIIFYRVQLYTYEIQMQFYKFISEQYWTFLLDLYNTFLMAMQQM